MKTFLDEMTSNRTVRIAIVAVLVLLALFLLAKTWDEAFGRDINDSYNTITVEGTGSAAMVPDTARITFTVMESAAEVAVAQEGATARTDAAIAALDEMDVEERDIKTLSYNVSPTYASQQGCFDGFGRGCPISSPVITGYEVMQTIEVKVRDTAKAGDVLAALGGLGVQNISGPEFVVDDETAVQNEARAEAIEEARAKAKELAGDLNVRLGKIVSFSEGGRGGIMPMYEAKATAGMDMAQSAPAPDLPRGQNQFTSNVSVTFRID